MSEVVRYGLTFLLLCVAIPALLVLAHFAGRALGDLIWMIERGVEADE